MLCMLVLVFCQVAVQFVWGNRARTGRACKGLFQRSHALLFSFFSEVRPSDGPHIIFTVVDALKIGGSKNVHEDGEMSILILKNSSRVW